MPTQSYKEFGELLRQKSFTEAASFAEHQSVLHGDKNEFWLTQQAVALNCAGKFDQAITLTEKALELVPNNYYALLAKADAILGTGRIKEALAYYEELITGQDKNITFRSRKGFLKCLVRLKDWPRILTLLGDWDIPTINGMYWRVKALMGLGRRDEAMGACREWLRLSPDNPQALWELTELEVAVEGVEAVRVRFGRLAKIPSRPPVYGEIYASLCRRTGKIKEAVEQYSKLSGSSAELRIQRKQAFALAKSGQEQTAIPLMEELLKLSPQDIYLHSAFTAACRRIGELERAWNFYQELVRLHPDVKSIYGRIRRIGKALEKG